MLDTVLGRTSPGPTTAAALVTSTMASRAGVPGAGVAVGAGVGLGVSVGAGRGPGAGTGALTAGGRARQRRRALRSFASRRCCCLTNRLRAFALRWVLKYRRLAAFIPGSGHNPRVTPTLELLLVAGLASCLVAVSTAASRVWGHGIGGLISAFPLIVGPVLLIAALEEGPQAAAETAGATLLGLVALSGFALAYGRSALGARWPLSLLAGWLTAAALALVAARFDPGLAAAVLVAALSLVVAWLALPRDRAAAAVPLLPRWELPLRMALTALLIVGIAAAGRRFGPTVAGLLAALPTLASVLAAFTHARHGGDALIALLRGMLSGMGAFVVFCAVIGVLVERVAPAPAFVLATVAAVLVQAAASRTPAVAGLGPRGGGQPDAVRPS